MTDPLLNLNAAAMRVESIDVAIDYAVEQLDSRSESPRLDAEILLSHVLGKNRAFLRAWPDARLDPARIGEYLELIDARKKGTPIAYLTGYREFWSKSFRVGPAVLVPRPETELLVEMALEIIPRNKPVKILELGTGSGIIALSLALERPGISILASDISPGALSIARENASRLQIANVRFLNSNWFDQIPQERFELIVSNPPYVAETDPHLTRGDLAFEPEIALKSGPTGLEALRSIADQACDWLNPGGHLLLEHGFAQADDLRQLLQRFNYGEIATRADLQGHPRATRSKWAGSS